MNASATGKSEERGVCAHKSDRLDQAGQGGNWNGDVADGDQDGHDFGAQLDPGSVDRMTDAEGLKHAPETVIEVIAEHDHSDDVEQGDGPNLESGDHIIVNVVFVEGTAGMNRAEGEVKQVKDDKGEDNRAAPHHGPRGVCRSDIVFFDVGNGAGLLLQQPKLQGGPDVQEDGEKKADARGPEKAGMGLQRGGVMVDLFLRDIDLQVAEEMTDNETEENDAGDRHNRFFANGGLPET